MKEIDKSILITKKGFGATKDKILIDWKANIGKKIKFIYDDINGELEIIDYMSKGQKVTVKYNDKIKIINSTCLLNCQIGNIIGINTSDYKYNIGDEFIDNKRNFKIIGYKRNKNKGYMCYCNKCKQEFWKSESHIKDGRGCPFCTNKIIKKGINDIATTDHWMIDYFKNKEDGYKYSSCSNKAIPVICPCCKIYQKEQKINDLKRYKSINCPICSDGISYPEKFMSNLLDLLNETYIYQYSPSWVSPRRYDFYIPRLNIIIETDGDLGHGVKTHSHSKTTIQDSIDIDNKKDELAKNNGIEVIRIDCKYGTKNRFEYIKNSIIKSKLSNYIDFINVDWDLINKKALESYIIKVSNLKKENPDITTGEISKIINKPNSTIINWLKQGEEAGLCEYNSDEELKKSWFKSKKVKAFTKDGRLINIFESYNDCISYMNENFNINLTIDRLTSICNGSSPNKDGYVFRKLEDDFYKYLPIKCKDHFTKIIKNDRVVFIGSSLNDIISFLKEEYDISLYKDTISKYKNTNKEIKGFKFETITKDEYLNILRKGGGY